MLNRAMHHLVYMESNAAQQARLWLERRGITTEAIGRWGIGYNEEWRQVVDGVKLPPGILIPRYDADWQLQAVNVYLNAAARAMCKTRRMFVKGSQAKVFMGAPHIAAASTSIITEGEFDAVLLDRFAPAGTAVVTTGGASTIPDNLATLDGKRVALCFDNDEAGRNGAKVWGERLPELQVISSPKGKDCTDAWKAGFDLAKWLKGALK